jgi:hypothetical protein
MATVEVDRATLQIVFDVAVSSMQFGSGFLVDEEVTGLRAIAVCLGIDPMKATPDNFRCKYTGRHEPWGENYSPQYARVCRYCKATV